MDCDYILFDRIAIQEHILWSSDGRVLERESRSNWENNISQIGRIIFPKSCSLHFSADGSVMSSDVMGLHTRAHGSEVLVIYFPLNCVFWWEAYCDLLAWEGICVFVYLCISDGKLACILWSFGVRGYWFRSSQGVIGKHKRKHK